MTTFAFAASLSLIVAGVGLVYVPAAFIVAGVLLAASAWLYDAGATQDTVSSTE